jgi:hypothetical protein
MILYCRSPVTSRRAHNFIAYQYKTKSLHARHIFQFQAPDPLVLPVRNTQGELEKNKGKKMKHTVLQLQSPQPSIISGVEGETVRSTYLSAVPSCDMGGAGGYQRAVTGGIESWIFVPSERPW